MLAATLVVTLRIIANAGLIAVAASQRDLHGDCECRSDSVFVTTCDAEPEDEVPEQLGQGHARRVQG